MMRPAAPLGGASVVVEVGFELTAREAAGGLPPGGLELGFPLSELPIDPRHLPTLHSKGRFTLTPRKRYRSQRCSGLCGRSQSGRAMTAQHTGLCNTRATGS